MIRYYRNGIRHAESSHSDKLGVAKELLRRRMNEICAGTFIEAHDRKVTVDTLYHALLDDYRNNQMRSLECTLERWQSPARNGEELPPPGRLKQFFSGIRAITVTTDTLNRYVAKCLDEGIGPDTVNRDLAALRRAFYLGLRAGKLQKVPRFPHLKEPAPRSGFVEEAEYRKLVAVLPATELWLRALLATAYTFGFRKGELLNLRVRQISLVDRTIRLNPGTTKSGEGRIAVMTTDVFTLLGAMVAGKQPDDHVFTRRGVPVVDFRDAWASLCAAAGFPGLLFHDLRRSAVRNMVRRGIPERVAMQISGHKTRAVFERYNIVSEADIAEAARKIEMGQQYSELGHQLGTKPQQDGAKPLLN
jgi:integrase